MAINLQKKQTISLSKENRAPLQQVSMGLGWDAKSGLFGLGGTVDLDASCLLFDAQHKMLDVVWFRQLQSHDGAVSHSGDNRTGAGDGDDETIRVRFNDLRASVAHLVFTVSNFTGQNFDKVRNAYCRVSNDRGEEIARYSLGEEARGKHNGLILLKVSRVGSDWECTALGKAVDGRTWHDLQPLIRDLL